MLLIYAPCSARRYSVALLSESEQFARNRPGRLLVQLDLSLDLPSAELQLGRPALELGGAILEWSWLGASLCQEPRTVSLGAGGEGVLEDLHQFQMFEIHIDSGASSGLPVIRFSRRHE